MPWEGQRSQSPRRRDENIGTLFFPRYAEFRGIPRPVTEYKIPMIKYNPELSYSLCKDVYC